MLFRELAAFFGEFYEAFAHVVFAVDWRKVARANVVDHAREFVLAAVAGGVDVFDLVVNDFCTEHGEFVDDGVDLFFVAGDW